MYEGLFYDPCSVNEMKTKEKKKMSSEPTFIPIEGSPNTKHTTSPTGVYIHLNDVVEHDGESSLLLYKKQIERAEDRHPYV